MGQPTIKRYIFIEYSDLLQLNVTKLKGRFSKMFVFIDTSVTSNIPLQFVQKILPFGDKIKLIGETPNDDQFNFHICFMMGQLHFKVGKKASFTVFSDNASFDDIIKKLKDGGSQATRYELKVARQAKVNNNKLPIKLKENDPFFSTEEESSKKRENESLKDIGL